MRVVAVIAVLLFAVCLAASQAPAQTGGKIGVVDTQRVLAQTAQGKAAQAELEGKFSPREKQLQALQAEINKLQGELQQRGATLSDTEQARRTNEIQQKQKQLERLNEDTQTEFNNERQAVITRLAKGVDEVVRKYGTDNGYLLILDAGQAGTLFAGKGADITDEIIAAYDKQFPAGAARPAPPAAKPPAPAAKKP